ncbi:tagatose 1,6-diphosphate aldolase [Alsobacter sp. KACC 23698]|uniref:Tagatose 1,6-diphosphate aldolase n=1 Tax=Alsobacter sp. KACC 23698 TaxID=3149229 RepID=A0AAU7JIC1_9HYPH
MELSPGKLWGLRRMADAQGRFKMTAVDQRPPIKNPIREARGTDAAPYEDVAAFKLMLVEELQGESSAMLLDPHFALPGGMTLLSPAKGLIVTLEDSIFQDTPGGRLSGEIDDWSVEKIKRCGGDAVKVLAWYRRDAAPDVCRAQEDFVARVGEACARYDIPFVFELLVYPLPGEANQTTQYVEMADKKAELVLDSVRRFAHPRYGVDLFKLESPVPARDCLAAASGGPSMQEHFNALGQAAGRPWVMLSAGAGMQEFKAILNCAYKAGASGYLAGRAIWAQPFRRFPEWDEIRAGLRLDSLSYMRELNAMTDAKAKPWFAHPLYGGTVRVANVDGSFRRDYQGFGP